MSNVSRHFMADLQALARQKADAEQQKRVRALPADIKALQRQLAAKGQLGSGFMLKQVLGICQRAMVEQGEATIVEYRWAIAQALFASQSWVARLITDSVQLGAPLYDEAVAQVTKAAEMAGMPQLAERLIDDLQTTRVTVANDITLALNSAFAEKRRGLIRSLPSSLLRFLAKPFSGGSA